MKIFETLEEIKDIEPSAVALGNFDGVHLGPGIDQTDGKDSQREESEGGGIHLFQSPKRSFAKRKEGQKHIEQKRKGADHRIPRCRLSL